MARRNTKTPIPLLLQPAKTPEIFIKKLESRLHSIVGGDGAIYAIRKELYEPLQATDINDLVNPLQIIAKGYRGVYEPEAICREQTSGSFTKEFNRKVRIVNRSFSGLLRVGAVLNPFDTGMFSFQIISHKLLRWLAPFFILAFVGASTSLALLPNNDATLFQTIVAFIALFVFLAYLGYSFVEDPHLWPIFHYPYYFIAVNTASMDGTINRRCFIQILIDAIHCSQYKNGHERNFNPCIGQYDAQQGHR